MSDSKNKMPIFELMRMIRDSRAVKNAQRLVLDALALRCRTDQDFRAWPSYRQLALDTGLNITTLKRTAKKLEQRNLIHRKVKANKANTYFINGPLLKEMAEAARKEDAAAKMKRKLMAYEAARSPFIQLAHDEAELNAPTQEINNDEDSYEWNVGGGQ